MPDRSVKLERARLTGEELLLSVGHEGEPLARYDEKRKVANAQLAKALWAVVDWLRENCIDAETGERYGIVGFLGLELSGLLLEAGIEEVWQEAKNV